MNVGFYLGKIACIPFYSLEKCCHTYIVLKIILFALCHLFLLCVSNCVICALSQEGDQNTLIFGSQLSDRHCCQILA